VKTNRMAVVAAIFAVAAVVGSACPAWADYLTGVTVDSVSSEIASRLAGYTIDSDATFDPVAGTLKASERGWMIQGTDYSPTIVYNLGVARDLASIHVWNWNQAAADGGDNWTKQGIKDINIYTAGTDKAFTLLGSYALNKATGADGYTGQTIAASFNDVQYVKLVGLDSWYASDGFYDRGNNNWMNETGLAKVQFSAVPEPSTLTLFAAGLAGLLAYVWRKRK
jgi:hypothetical protein